MNPLASRIAALIAAQGPISVGQFMMMAMHDREHGYYATRDPFGAKGDFVTAPEVSQMFGELVGLWCVQCWHDQGAPKPARLIELGPGRGTLMHDALRAAKTSPRFLDAIEIVLVEASPALADVQRKTLRAVTAPIVWNKNCESSLFDRPCFVIANEFFDALPVRQFVRTDRGWHERMVALESGVLGLTLSPVPATLGAARAASPGAVLEISTAADALASEIAHGIATSGGAALIVDYGHDGGFGETLQAVRSHAPAELFAAPGESDLSADVDFAALAASARAEGAAVYGPICQGEFLERLGIGVRAEALSRNAPSVASDLARLVAPDQMGTLFKALAFLPAGAPRPQGF